MKYKGIIFDLDGVICSTDRYHYHAWKKIAELIDVDFDEKFNDRFRGVCREECLKMLLQKSGRKFSGEEKKELLKRKNDYYRQMLSQMTADDVDIEVKSTLDKLREKGMLLGIGSSSKNARLILAQIDMKDYFDAVCDGNDISRSKPDPEVFIRTANLLGLSPDQCLIVEDAQSGIEAATAGGFDSAGIGAAGIHEKVNFRLQKFSDLLKIQ